MNYKRILSRDELKKLSNTKHNEVRPTEEERYERFKILVYGCMKYLAPIHAKKENETNMMIAFGDTIKLCSEMKYFTQKINSEYPGLDIDVKYKNNPFIGSSNECGVILDWS